MSEDYKRITRILVWIVALSMIAYFVITPFTYFRQTPPSISPATQEIIPTTTEILPTQTQSFPTSVPSNLLPDDNQSESLPIQ